MHGGSFNDGPRRRLPLLPGCGEVKFPITTADPAAQQFFNQGVAQLHGFWFWEAERSFRTVLAIDPACTMAHWGLAMANIENENRARDFMKRAVAVDKLTPREKAYIESGTKFFKEKKNDQERKDAARELVRNLEGIALDFDDDEARAGVAMLAWRNNNKLGMDLGSSLSIDALCQQVLSRNPQHPVHHYLIHLWDHERPARGLPAAAACGPCAPAVAHMWHMPGHIYADLQRWADSAWQQEAAARVDHAQMIRSHIWPDQIHNFAHNSEWLVRNYNNLGRVQDSLTVSMNLIAMPRIPRSESVTDKPDQQFKEEGSAWQYGRNRLIETLLRWELWDTALSLSATPLLAGAEQFDDQWKAEQLQGLAGYGKGDAAAGRAGLALLEARESALQKDRAAAAATAEAKARTDKKSADDINKAMAEAMLPVTKKLEKLQPAIQELRLRDHLAAGRKEEAGKLVDGLRDVHEHRTVLIHLALGNIDKAVDQAKGFAAKSDKLVQPHALYAWVLWQAGRKDEAVAEFQKLRPIAAWSDLQTPALARLQPVAAAAGVEGDWRIAEAKPTDVGTRPGLDTLGPVEWHPWDAPAWTAVTRENQPVSSDSMKGRPHVLILFLGSACTHCNAQLKAFSEAAPAFEKAGLPVLALSTDDAATISAAGNPAPFPVHSAADKAAFHAFDAWDDFENKPLHATCYIDAAGHLAWQHVSYEPFMRPDFLITEIQRLESLRKVPAATASAPPAPAAPAAPAPAPAPAEAAAVAMPPAAGS